jgi:hypothetical protein
MPVTKFTIVVFYTRGKPVIFLVHLWTGCHAAAFWILDRLLMEKEIVVAIIGSVGGKGQPFGLRARLTRRCKDYGDFNLDNTQ